MLMLRQLRDHRMREMWHQRRREENLSRLVLKRPPNAGSHTSLRVPAAKRAGHDGTGTRLVRAVQIRCNASVTSQSSAAWHIRNHPGDGLAKAAPGRMLTRVLSKSHRCS